MATATPTTGIAVTMTKLAAMSTATAAAVTVFPLGGIYPLMKRVTYWPQAWLGTRRHRAHCMRTSLLRWGHSSWAAGYEWNLHLRGDGLRRTNTSQLDALITITIYTCQDKRDDGQAGIKSTAILFGEHVKTILAVSTGFLVACLTVDSILDGQGVPSFSLTVGGATSYLIMQLRNLDIDDTKSCFTALATLWVESFGAYL
ncbi:hypothetical protein BJV78DRAFT_1155523 [Lactifluus subvellereus]|nr:hypothetical protein BJV78DRAFT_1155523 [Lactifluus subvellereus]